MYGQSPRPPPPLSKPFFLSFVKDCVRTQNGGIPRCVRTQNLTLINKTGCLHKIRLLFLSALWKAHTFASSKGNKAVARERQSKFLRQLNRA